MEQQNASSKTKPTFVMTDQQIYFNLHQSALISAAKAIGVHPNRTINQFIINSLCNDGKNILDDTSKPENGTSSINPKGESRFEFAIVMQIPKLERLRGIQENGEEVDETALKELEKNNRNLIKECRRKINSGINAYFKTFSGIDNAYGEQDMVLYIPKYEGGRIQVKKDGSGCSIIGLDEKEENIYMSIYDPDSSFKPSNSEIDKFTRDANLKARIGYKVGYIIK